jgi:hypothetical protein
MKKISNWKSQAILTVSLIVASRLAAAQVGIGTINPQEKLHINEGSILGTSINTDPTDNPFYDPSNPENLEHGFKWFHDRCAFRSVAQVVGGFALSPSEINYFSFASGFEAYAHGFGGTSMGIRTSAEGEASFATGFYTTASGAKSFAAGNMSTASGDRSVAIGYKVSTNNKTGSFIFGDASSFGNSKSDEDNQMMMRFAGGYKLFTDAGSGIGVLLLPNSNSWSAISDVNKKENFAPVNGEDFLQKIAKMSLTSWNYKGQDPKQYRHYGPMAQDFYKAFGQDAFGTIGTDTTINQADFDGINLIAVQALIRRMEEMSLEIATIKAELAEARSEHGRKKKRILAIQK